ncbi:MAG: flagellar hook-basal body protein [Dysosmobacter sp.]|nr:flagellar hook-basal body protein [Dysosmobacter sp.]
MFKGFYNLTSAMLTHQHNLNVIGNNMVNISTAGYKQERYTASTFDDVMYSRVDVNHSSGTEIGRQSYIRAASQIYTDYSQGIPEPTDLPLDFAIVGDGFFAVQDQEGEVAYTRMGNFSLDDRGYLCLPGFGQVLNPQGQPIYLGTDKIRGDGRGVIYYNQEDGESVAIGQLGVYSFEDNEALVRNDRGLFTGEGAQQSQNYEIWNKYLERSNSDMVKQMTEMITYQRALQSAAQVSKMYDQLMAKATGDVGRFA